MGRANSHAYVAMSMKGPGLIAWDRAPLHAVYRTKQKERLRLSEIETGALDEIVATAAR
jgi:hypothetical protein